MESISKILECPICLQKMSEPKMLPCQHTFCLECTKKVATRNQVQCALCQRKHKLPVNGVIGFPNNSILAALLQITDSYKVNLVLSFTTTIPEIDHLSNSKKMRKHEVIRLD